MAGHQRGQGQYKGSGTINGQGNYGFLLTAVDGQISGGGETDMFRIKIVDKSTGQTIYDNQMGQDENSSAATALSGGIITIHTLK